MCTAHFRHHFVDYTNWFYSAGKCHFQDGDNNDTDQQIFIWNLICFSKIIDTYTSIKTLIYLLSLRQCSFQHAYSKLCWLVMSPWFQPEFQVAKSLMKINRNKYLVLSWFKAYFIYRSISHSTLFINLLQKFTIWYSNAKINKPSIYVANH
jgi:hypothetical protein